MNIETPVELNSMILYEGDLFIIYHIVAGLTGDITYDNAKGEYVSTVKPYCKIEIELPKNDTLYYMHNYGYYALRNNFIYEPFDDVYNTGCDSRLIVEHAHNSFNLFNAIDLNRINPSTFVEFSLSTVISNNTSYWNLTIPHYHYAFNLKDVPLYGFIKKPASGLNNPSSSQYAVLTNVTNYVGPTSLASNKRYKVMIYKDYMFIDEC
jgi:hypothetical protein